MRFSGTLFLISLLAAAPVASAGDGEAFFSSYCASCHGQTGKGDGKMAPMLEVKVADLSKLSAENGGTFPMARAIRRIDGRELVESHGNPKPIWSKLFRSPDLVSVKTDEGVLEVDPTALDVVEWLQSIQS